MAGRLLSFEPILAYELGELAHQMTARHGGTAAGHRRLLKRAEAAGTITLDAADKVAAALGTHPLCLWGKAWERPGESVEDLQAGDEAPHPAIESAGEPASETSSPHACRYPGCDARADTEDQLADHTYRAHPKWCRVCHRSFDTARGRATHQARAHGKAAEHTATTQAPPSDLELEAIATCWKTLTPLPPAGRCRALDYLAQRFVVDAGAET